MKVCFIAGTLARGGAERQLVYILRALQSEGIQTRLLCLTKGEAYQQEIEDRGIEVTWIGSSGNRLVRLVAIVADLRKRNVDILQSAHFYTNMYAAIAGRILRIRTIGAIRNDLTSEMLANGIYGRWQLKLPHHLIANSETASNRAEMLGIRPRHLHLLKNVVESRNGVRETKRTIGNRINILFAGRLVEQKRPELFVQLAARLVRDLPGHDLAFRVAGDGPLKNSLEKMVAMSTLSRDQFTFMGAQADMTEVYRQTDILVLTSAHEGTPNVVLEAMANAIPVVATEVGGVPELLSANRGFLVDPADIGGLCAATTKLIRDSDLRRRLGRNGLEYVTETHSLRHLGKRLKCIYSDLVGGDRLDR